MLSDVDPATHVAVFWVPVSQIIPVLALAFVIEARRTASSWKLKKKSRIPQAFFVVAMAYLVYHIESRALVHMAFGTSDPTDVMVTILGVSAMVIVLTVNPVLRLLIAGVPEIYIIMSRLPKESPWRAFRRRVREALQKSRQGEKAALSVIARSEAFIARQKPQLEESRSAVPVFEKFLASAAVGEKGVTAETLSKAFEVFEEARADATRRENAIAEATSVIEDTRGHLAELLQGREELKTLRRGSRIYKMDDDDYEVMESILDDIQNMR